MELTAPLATLLTAFITGSVTLCGFLIVHYSTRKRETEARKFEILLKESEEQIGLFYGPLYALVQHILVIRRVQDCITTGLKNNAGDNSSLELEIESYLREKFFFRLHSEIREVLKERLYLLGESEIKPSYHKYLAHSTMQEIQQTLWHEKQVSTINVTGLPWSDDFPKDIKDGLDAALKRRKELLQRLGHA